MAKFQGRLGAIYAPTGTVNLAAVTLAQVGATADYVIATAATRITRAFLEAAAIADFSLDSGTITALKRPVGAVTVSGGTPPYALTSSNLVVATLAEVAGFTDWELTVQEDVVETTTFGAEFRQRDAILKGWSATAERFWVDENFSVDVGAAMKALTDVPFVVLFFVNSQAANYYRHVGFALVEGLSLNVPVGAIITERLTFRGHKELYFRVANT